MTTLLRTRQLGNLSERPEKRKQRLRSPLPLKPLLPCRRSRQKKVRLLRAHCIPKTLAVQPSDELIPRLVVPSRKNRIENDASACNLFGTANLVNVFVLGVLCHGDVL